MKWIKGLVVGTVIPTSLVLTSVSNAQISFNPQKHLTNYPMSSSGSVQLDDSQQPNRSILKQDRTQTIAARSHVLSLNQGQIQCQILNYDQLTNSQRSNMEICLLQTGRVMHQARTDAEGKFTIKNAQPGFYTLIATSNAGFTTYGVYVSQDAQPGSNLIEAATVSPMTGGLAELIEKCLPQQVARQITQPRSNLPPTDEPCCTQVRLIHGKLTGNISCFNLQGKCFPVQGAIVNLIHNGQRIADAEVGRDGSYTIANLEPGIYDCIVVGHEAFTAIRFEALDQDGSMFTVSYQRPKLVATSLDVVLPDSQLQVNPAVQQSVIEPANPTPSGQSWGDQGNQQNREGYGSIPGLYPSWTPAGRQSFTGHELNGFTNRGTQSRSW